MLSALLFSIFVLPAQAIHCPPDLYSMDSTAVARWLTQQGVATDVVSRARDHEIDGHALSTATQEALVSALGMKLGTATRVKSCLATTATGKIPRPTVHQMLIQCITGPNALKNFGFGLSQGHIHRKEETLYEYKVSNPESFGVMTHWWITGGSYMCGNDTTTCPGPLSGNGDWNPFIDFVVFRYYID